MLGTYALSAGYYDAYYGQAQRVRTLIIRDFARAYEQFDVLLSPTSPTVAFELGAKTADPLAMYLSDVCTIPTNLAGHAGDVGAVRDRRRRAADRRAGARARARRADDVPRRARDRAGAPRERARSAQRQNAAVMLVEGVGGFPLEEVAGVRDEQRSGAVEARGRGLPRERRQHDVVLGAVQHERRDRRLLEELRHVLHRALAGALLVHAPARAQLVRVGVRLGVERRRRRR